MKMTLHMKQSMIMQMYTIQSLLAQVSTLLLLVKEVCSARLRVSDIHPISEDPCPTIPTNRQKEEKIKKIVEDYSMDRAA